MLKNLIIKILRTYLRRFSLKSIIKFVNKNSKCYVQKKQKHRENDAFKTIREGYQYLCNPSSFSLSGKKGVIRICISNNI